MCIRDSHQGGDGEGEGHREAHVAHVEHGGVEDETGILQQRIEIPPVHREIRQGAGERIRGEQDVYKRQSPRWVTESLRGLMAKKMLSLHATFKRAVPSWPAGMVTLAEPELRCV